MKRGDIVIAAASGDYGKPRPYVVVQTDVLNATHASIIVCPITSDTHDHPYRLAIGAGQATGLRDASEAMIDKPQSLRRERIQQTIGHLPPEALRQMDSLLMFILGLQG